MELLSSDALIICSKDRFRALSQTFEILASCTSLPALIMLSDASVEPYDIQTFIHNLPPSIQVQYYPSKPHLTAQRNAMIRHLPSSIEFVHFIDDDFWVEHDYFSTLHQFLVSNPKKKLVGGAIRNNQEYDNFSFHLQCLFGLNSYVPGKFLSNGCTTEPQARAFLPSTSPYTVDWISGCSMSGRTSVFQQWPFNEHFEGYGQDEDLDFCLRVGQHTRIWVVPQSGGVHMKAKDSRNKPDVHRAMAIQRRFEIWRALYPDHSPITFCWFQLLKLCFVLYRPFDHWSIFKAGLKVLGTLILFPSSSK